MAKGSVRKKGKKWYYRFYVEDASGNLVQKEFTGTESKSETEKLLRQAMEDYESKKFIAKAGLSKDYIHSFSAVLQQSFRFAVFPKQLITFNPMQYRELYHRNYYKEVHDRNRVYYEYCSLENTQEVPADYNEISFVCIRPGGCLETPSTLSIVCRTLAKKLDGFEGFHFHQLRHTYTSNLLSNGASPKDVQELLGHSDVCTTMNVSAHVTREAKRTSARLLDRVAGND